MKTVVLLSVCVYAATTNQLPDPGEYIVLLADRKLLELPLESLSLLQEEGLSSVSRDFSLQLLHSRLNREEQDKGNKSTCKQIFEKSITSFLIIPICNFKTYIEESDMSVL